MKPKNIKRADLGRVTLTPEQQTALRKIKVSYDSLPDNPNPTDLPSVCSGLPRWARGLITTLRTRCAVARRSADELAASLANLIDKHDENYLDAGDWEQAKRTLYDWKAIR